MGTKTGGDNIIALITKAAKGEVVKIAAYRQLCNSNDQTLKPHNHEI